jgi:hypothetical protein
VTRHEQPSFAQPFASQFAHFLVTVESEIGAAVASQNDGDPQSCTAALQVQALPSGDQPSCNHFGVYFGAFFRHKAQRLTVLIF